MFVEINKTAFNLSKGLRDVSKDAIRSRSHCSEWKKEQFDRSKILRFETISMAILLVETVFHSKVMITWKYYIF